jgi:hypothetical protein
MSGFGNKPKKKSKTKIINEDEVGKLMKKYKRIKRFMNSPLHEVKRIDGEKTIVEDLLDEYHEELDDYYERNPEELSDSSEEEDHYAQSRVDYQAGLDAFLTRKGHGQMYGDNGKSGGFE